MTEQERKDLIGELFQKKLDTCDDGHECDMYLFDLEEMSDEELRNEAEKDCRSGVTFF